MDKKDLKIKFSGPNAEALLNKLINEGDKIGLIAENKSIKKIADKVDRKNLKPTKTKKIAFVYKGKEESVELAMKQLEEEVKVKLSIEASGFEISIEGNYVNNEID